MDVADDLPDGIAMMYHPPEVQEHYMGVRVTEPAAAVVPVDLSFRLRCGSLSVAVLGGLDWPVQARQRAKGAASDAEPAAADEPFRPRTRLASGRQPRDAVVLVVHGLDLQVRACV
jgi:hypothetical protein